MHDGQRTQGATRAAAEPAAYTIRKRENTRWWEVCLTVYRRGAREVVRRLTG